MGGLVHVVVAFWLEKEVAGLAGGHADQPGDEGRHRRIEQDEAVGNEKAERAQQMQALIDAAVMIVAMVVPTLRREFLQEGLHFPILVAVCRLGKALLTPFVAGRTGPQLSSAFAEANEREVP
jgi:hypothetical protein